MTYRLILVRPNRPEEGSEVTYFIQRAEFSSAEAAQKALDTEYVYSLTWDGESYVIAKEFSNRLDGAEL